MTVREVTPAVDADALLAGALLSLSASCVFQGRSDPSMRFAKAIMRRIPESARRACAR
ncbi:hypothetical protein GWE18_26290 [Bradyrhizobium sp. CSA112]|uniref:hypothetical protein n=1 Tax=Bradyrhizobium sp. CSA112 TaxID=2699170 RepID=UPI0023AF8B43|nr:hypothetical protein [Bradyrhizobium sp. CSA112]MDE5456274.1 hypothetical protein [Bradyrhizobium sp. CSA112]